MQCVKEHSFILTQYIGFYFNRLFLECITQSGDNSKHNVSLN